MTLNLNELYARISARFWDSGQVADWVTSYFFRRNIHKQTRTGTEAANLPIITDPSGYIDSSFISSSGLGTWLHALTGKNTPVDADELLIADSAASFTLKKLTWANLRAFAFTWTGAHTFSSTAKFDSTITLSDSANSGTQDYLLTSRSSAYSIQAQSSGNSAVIDLFTKDGDGTDSIAWSIWGVGLPSSIANRERLLIQWDTTRYDILTEANGTGTVRALAIYTGSNTEQLVLGTDGSVSHTQATLGSAVLKLASTATNDDPTGTFYQNRVATTNATITTIHTFAIPTNTTVLITGYVYARRTGGTSGTAGDSSYYRLEYAAKDISGTVSQVASAAAGAGVTEFDDQAAWTCAFSISGTNVLLRVTGAANNNVTWHMEAWMRPLST